MLLLEKRGFPCRMGAGALQLKQPLDPRFALGVRKCQTFEKNQNQAQLGGEGTVPFLTALDTATCLLSVGFPRAPGIHTPRSQEGHVLCPSPSLPGNNPFPKAPQSLPSEGSRPALSQS